ncbi:tau-cadinol synthase-like [Triticum dicoccoides]|uniref:Terpene synthase n=1 Tax=Triticum aestivum TaxID=4565 RepID=A0A3B6BWS5_WHEAT|nr:tau-cadinol synthase-like [Triticum dicoccoides]XP_044321329.1 tau-cadinol synthase-like [Triticum aestivum]
MASSSHAAATPETKEQLGFEPSSWGDFFIAYEPPPPKRSEEWMIARAEKLKGDVSLLFKTCNGTTTRMFLVDTLQHLGIDHHFDEQIHDLLNELLESDFSSSSSLHEVALRFCLLRENGHWVSPDVFDKYKGEDGSFRKDITNDPKGILCLYNATHLLIHGEPKLEEAMCFARQHLVSVNGSLQAPLAKQVKRAIHRALPRACRRVEALQYISEYEEEEGHNQILLELAKLDFNLLQHVHLKELKDITEWWKHFSGFIDLSFIRDRLVESYTWAYVLYYEKGFELQRSITTKMIVLITTLDDTYDIRATIEECRKLHEAIQRWDKTGVSLLPEYLKKLYIELLRTFENIEVEMPVNVNYDTAYLKKAIQNHVTGYLQEAEWCHTKHKPSFKNQVNVTSLTIGAPTVCLSMMASMDDTIMKRALEWVAGVPNVVIGAGKIVRFMNDIAAYENRKCKGDAASSVECYIHEYGVTGEVAIARIYELIEDEWRTLNKARFENHALLPALKRIIGLALSTSLFYDNRNDVYTDSKHLHKTIKSLFVKPVLSG